MYRHYAVIGNPVLHSLSPLIHQRAFDFHKINARYFAYEVQDFPAFMDYFHGKANAGQNHIPYSYLGSQENLYAQGQKLIPYAKADFSFPLQGLSVTIPHKKEVLKIADKISYRAQLSGAANTLYWDNGKLTAENTDIAGFYAPLQTYLQNNSPFKTAMIYGAGGAACAVLAALLHLRDLEEIFLCARREEQAKELITHITGHKDLIAKHGLNNCVKISHIPLVHEEFPCDLTVNTIPQWNENAQSPRQNFTGVRFAYDLTYKETPFLERAKNFPLCHAQDGKTMFIEQAKTQFRLWTGLDIPEGCYNDIF